jgi:hypothetical protein
MPKSVSKETLHRHMDEVLDHFDFEKVHKVMTMLNWVWTTGGNGYEIPSTARMRQAVRELMKRAVEMSKKTEIGCVGSGGFQVSYEKPRKKEKEPLFVVKFVLTEYDSELAIPLPL